MTARDEMQIAMDFLRRSHEPVSIAGVTFWIAPQSIEFPYRRYHKIVGTRGGYGRWAYGTEPAAITFRGTTGLAGYYGIGRRLGGIMQMLEVAPTEGSYDRIVTFIYPNMFHGVKHVAVEMFRPSADVGQGHLYQYYDFELTEVGRHVNAPGAVRVPDAVGADIGLPVTP